MADFACLTLCLLSTIQYGQADDSSDSSAIAQTIKQAAHNPQIANTNAQTGGAGAAGPASGTALLSFPTTPLQTTDINKALTTATNAATQLIQNAPPAPQCVSSSHLVA